MLQVYSPFTTPLSLLEGQKRIYLCNSTLQLYERGKYNDHHKFQLNHSVSPIKLLFYNHPFNINIISDDSTGCSLCGTNVIDLKLSNDYWI